MAGATWVKAAGLTVGDQIALANGHVSLPDDYHSTPRPDRPRGLPASLQQFQSLIVTSFDGNQENPYKNKHDAKSSEDNPPNKWKLFEKGAGDPKDEQCLSQIGKRLSDKLDSLFGHRFHLSSVYHALEPFTTRLLRVQSSATRQALSACCVAETQAATMYNMN